MKPFLKIILSKNSFKMGLLLVHLLFLPGLAQEVQVPIDTTLKIDYIDSALEKKLGLFPQYDHFKHARVFRIPDQTYVLEVYYQPADTLLKARIPISVGDLIQFQDKVRNRFLEFQKIPEFDQSGRTKLIAGSMLLSLGYYGWAVPASMEVHDGKLAIALYMLTSSAGFALPLTSTREIKVTEAAANLALYGGTRGIAHGVALANLITEDPSFQKTVGIGVVTSIAELFAGFHHVRLTNKSAGTAETIGIGGDFGLGLGLGVAHLANLFDHDNNRGIGAGALMGSGIGLVAGNWLAQRQPYTRGDAHVLFASGLLGAYLPLALVDISGTENEKVYTASSMIGSLIGLALGEKFVKDKSFSSGEGNLIRLGEVAGGLLGLGIAYLISSEDADNTSLYLTSSAIGATAGFWLMYNSYATMAHDEFSLNFDIHPEGLMALLKPESMKFVNDIPMPLFSVSCEF